MPSSARVAISSPPRPEREGVASLEAQHPLALSGEPDQEPVDAGLGERVIGAPLARVDLLRVPAREREHPRRDEAIVDHDVRLLHEAHRAEGEQVRVAGTGADEVDLPDGGAGGIAAFVQQRPQRGASVLESSREGHLRDWAFEDPVPERASIGDSGQTRVDFVARRARASSARRPKERGMRVSRRART